MKRNNASKKQTSLSCASGTYALSKITVKTLGICVALLVLQGCELLSQARSSKPAPVTIINLLELCVTPLQKETFLDFCSLERWLEFVFETSELSWLERSSKITELDDDSRSLLQKILLSQAADTPYKQRLRAQNWIIKILAETSPTMNKTLNDLVYQNSQHLLEFESAITIMSRVNASQNKTIVDLQTQLDAREKEIKTQREQVDQLLKIETDLIEQNRSEER